MLVELDKKDTTILKGLAICAITFHNFFHILGPVHENEFTFDPARFPIFLRNLIHPSAAIQALFSFYGHYGVQIFIFLSAYGLAKSHWNDTSSWTAFMWSRIKKFYPMFALVLLFWTALAAIQVGPLTVLRVHAPGLLLILAGVSNLLPGGGLPVIGPWWFIPFIMQFYAIWPLLRALTKKFGWPALVALSLAALLFTLALDPILMRRSIYLIENPLGRMRILCLGIIAARYPLRINAPIALASLGVLILGSGYASFAPFASIAFTVRILWLYFTARGFLRKLAFFETLGNYSLAIFLLNGIVRVPFLMAATTPLLQLTMACASAALTLSLSVVFHSLLARTAGFVRPVGAPAAGLAVRITDHALIEPAESKLSESHAG